MYYHRRHSKNGNGSEQNLFDSTPSYNGEVKEFINHWNQHIWLPKLLGTDLQAKTIRNALQRPFFKNNWRNVFEIMAKSSFLLKKKWLTYDWVLEPDNFDKIIEGRYLDNSHKEHLPLPQDSTTLDPNREETL